jgi:hypothetical protein
MRKLLESIVAAAQMLVHVALGPVLHRWRTRWGASRFERQCALPGDELIPRPAWSYTHAIGIDAPREAVWPWLAQIGQGRGGFYSYELLENLAGCRIHNVLELRPELQSLHVGDVVRLHGSGYGPPVARIEPGRALVLGGEPDARGCGAIWGFHLFDGPNGTTRLVERGRNAVGGGPVARLAWGPYLTDPIGFVMSRKMLRTIKSLAERPHSKLGSYASGRDGSSSG